MKVRQSIPALALMMIVSISPAAADALSSDLASPAVTYSESFEEGWGGWVPDTDGLARDWDITRIPSIGLNCRDGSWCLSYYLDGTFDDGTIWLVRPFNVPPGLTLHVSMNFWLLNETDQPVNSLPVVAYIGVEPPDEEVDFEIVGNTNEKVGWNQYFHDLIMHPPDAGNIWVAFGISATWETERTYLLDLVEVTIS